MTVAPITPLPPLRLLYVVGPEKVIDSYQHWKRGQDTPSQVSVTFSSQFFDVCKALDALGYVVFESDDGAFMQDDRFTLKGRVRNFPQGLGYHLYQIRSGFSLLREARRFRVHAIVADSGTTHWFMLSLFPWFGIKVIPSLHCLLWKKYGSQKIGEKVTLMLSRRLFARDAQAILAASEDIAQQVTALTVKPPRPIFEFFPTYRGKDFSEIPMPPQVRSPFHVLFAGRVEVDKGVFDLLAIAQRFVADGITEVVFDICGDGSALAALRSQTQAAGLEATFLCHGYCSKSEMREMFVRSHVVIVPTRTDFVEGFNRVVAESVLSGRPVVTSAVCPALSYVREAVVEVPADDVLAYGDAVLALYRNGDLYEQKRQGCLTVQAQFQDPNRSWGFALRSILEKSGLA
jgi:glycogen synthase